jgi:hypothetical protein
VSIRSLVIEYKKARTREWEEAGRRWEAWQDEQQEKERARQRGEQPEADGEKKEEAKKKAPPSEGTWTTMTRKRQGRNRR